MAPRDGWEWLAVIWKRVLAIVAAVVAVLIVLVASGSHFFTDWLWFSSLDLQQVFWRSLLWERAVPAVVWVAFSVFFFVNLTMTKRSLLQLLWRIPQTAQVIRPGYITGLFAAASVLLGFFFAAGSSLFAMDVAKFFHGASFGLEDPLFGRDVSFYMFDLPFFRFLIGLLSGFIVPAFLACATIYGASGSIRFQGLSLKAPTNVVRHLSILAAGFVFLQALGHLLSVYDLMYSASGAVYGPGFTDVHVRVWVYRVLAAIAGAAGLVLLFGGRRRVQAFAGVAVVWLVVSVIFGGIVPGLVQAWIVDPNEYNREEPYLEHHIQMTRRAYDLDDIRHVPFDGSGELSWEVLQDNWATVENVRLWDPRPLITTYSQLQEMRLYYRFFDADIGRYHVNGQYRQVLLSPRELDISQLQNRTWINEHLQYTHGYGAVMSPVNEASAQGLPNFWISDIPPRSTVDIELDQPRIYFGERTNQYVIVNTRADEFDYPMGDRNAFYRYTGADGVEISTPLHRAAFALRFGTSRILLSTEITRESRVLFNRNIRQRAHAIAPFLRYDNDPYAVIHDGRLVWILDAYTSSDRYPYSRPRRGWGNYARNSVKVVIDAYDGTTSFYQVEDDPLLETYASIFPDLFEPIENMDPDLQRHIRYPEDFLALQAEMYGVYHMENTRLFYNQEDVWTFANEVYAGREQPVVPYYVMMQLPDQEVQQQEMVLMVPFTPIRRSNMVSWMAARNDAPHYGEVVVYDFPKDTLTLGPAQIEARIDQDGEISQLLSLWGQRGSQVIRGNLLVLPIADSLLYVEPLYLQSEQSGMPQLQRVIAAHGDDLVMESTLERALVELFGEMPPEELAEQIPEDVLRPREPDPVEDPGLIEDPMLVEDELPLDAEIPSRAASAYQRAADALQQGDFAAFGEAWNELDELLQEWQGRE